MNGICLIVRASDWRGLVGVQREVQGSDGSVDLHSNVSEIVGRDFTLQTLQISCGSGGMWMVIS